MSREAAERFLRGLADKPDKEIPIGEAALALAELDCPDLDPKPYRDHLAALAAETAAAAGSDPDLTARIAALNRTIVGGHGYKGDAETYDDLANANLIRVIERKRGLPVALGILYLHIAQTQGWPIVGLNFPGHFVVGMLREGRRAIIDPFNGGRVLDDAAIRVLFRQIAGADAAVRPEYLAPIGNRDVLVRLQNNLRSRHEQAGRVTAAIKVIESMLWFAPDRADLAQERVRLRTRLN